MIEKIYLSLKAIKTVRHYKECRDQQKSRIKQTFALERNCISSSKDYSTSFFYKKS